MRRDAPESSLPHWAKMLIVVAVCIQISFCWMARQRSLQGDVDLRAFYTAGIMVRHHKAESLYDPQEVTAFQTGTFGPSGRTLPFLYPAFAALPFVPFSSAPYTSAFCIVALINLVCLLAAAHLLGKSPADVKVSPKWLFALFLCFFPSAIALMQGQISFVLLLVFVGSYEMEARGHRFSAGLCLSLALAKFQLVLPIFLLYVLWRKWRLVLGFLSGGSVLAGTSLMLMGTSGARAYYHCLRGLGSAMLLAPDAAGARFGMQAAGEPNLHGLITTLAGAGTLGAVATIACSAAVLMWAYRCTSTLAQALPAALLVSYHMQPYDLLLLLLPITVLLRSFSKIKPGHLSLELTSWITGVIFLTFPMAAYLLVKQETAWFVCAVLAVLIAGRQVPK